MEPNSENLLQHLEEIEVAAEDILADKQQIIDLDRKRQKTREAVRIIQKDKSKQKNWVCFGNMFLKLPKKETEKLLDKDFDQLDNEISEIRKNLKPKVNRLYELQNKEEMKGFHLSPLTKGEMKAVEQML